MTLLGIWVASTLCLLCSAAELNLGPADDGQKIDRVYVIRRNLGESNDIPINRGIAAHSALLLHTASDDFYVLEFMDDSKVHLTKTAQNIVKTNDIDGWAHIKAVGRLGKKTKELNWTRQLKGAELNGKAYTPEDLKKKMEELVKGYSVWNKEYCHAAQERLRKAIGLKVE